MDSLEIRQAVTMIAKGMASRLTQGQIDYIYQYRWDELKGKTLQELVTELKRIEHAVVHLGEDEWAKQYTVRDPLRKGELPLCYKVKMDWEF